MIGFSLVSLFLVCGSFDASIFWAIGASTGAGIF
jgi:hypothetical protein